MTPPLPLPFWVSPHISPFPMRRRMSGSSRESSQGEHGCCCYCCMQRKPKIRNTVNPNPIPPPPTLAWHSVKHMLISLRRRKDTVRGMIPLVDSGHVLLMKSVHRIPSFHLQSHYTNLLPFAIHSTHHSPSLLVGLSPWVSDLGQLNLWRGSIILSSFFIIKMISLFAWK